MIVRLKTLKMKVLSIIEFKTWPGYQKVFQELTTDGTSFWLKSNGSTIVGLSTTRKYCDYEIFCDFNDVEDIISGYEFRKFWILWKNNTIVFGSGTTVFLRWKYAVKNLIKYVTFCSHKDSGMAYWKCYLPPVAIIENLPLKRLQGGEPYWVEVEDNFNLPDDALIGGFENEFLYIMRAQFRGSLTPGKFVPSVGLGFIAWGYTYPYESYECDTVEILCGYNCIWVPSKDNEVPAGAVDGGFTEDLETMYVGRVNYKGHLIIGKILPSRKCCCFAYKNKSILAKNFEVLVSPHSNVLGYC